MSESYLGQIRLFGFNYAPESWAACDGTILSIAQNTALFSILGTTYGGNGTTTFALPNLQGRVVMGTGQGPGLTNRILGQTAGAATVALKATNLPPHTHTLQVSRDVGNTAAPGATVLPSSCVVPPSPEPNLKRFLATAPAPAMAAMSPQMVGWSGSDQAHPNVQPVLGMMFCICTEGYYPSRP